MNPDERPVIIEDTPELQTEHLNAVFLQTSITVDMTRLVASTLRLRPDRIIVGETRDGAALAMIKAWNYRTSRRIDLRSRQFGARRPEQA